MGLAVELFRGGVRLRRPVVWWVLVLVLLAAGAAGWRSLHVVSEGDLAVARSSGSTRYLPPGMHFINPLRETLEVIPAGSFTVSGIAALNTRDGIPARLPFTARVSLRPREFEAAMGRLAGRQPRAMVTGGMEEALSVWGSLHTAAELLGSEAPDVQAPLRTACRRLGIDLESVQLQRPDTDIYVFLAENALVRDDLDGPRELIQAAHLRTPDDGRLVTAVGLLHEGGGNWPLAEDHYLRALSLQPGLESALGRLFLRYQAEGQLVRLEKLLADALAANPASVRLLNWQALTHVSMQRYPDAFLAMERALAMDPRSEVTLQNLASLYLLLGRVEDAASVYRQAQAANPESQPILLGLGVAELERGDLASARAALESARRHGPGTTPLHNALADVYRGLGLVERSIAELEASLALDPDQPETRRQLAELRGVAPR
jgi:tetratricopeptide (TPR) repeat protein